MKVTIIKRTAPNKAGMTVADVAAFLADVQDHNVPHAPTGGLVIRIRSTWRGTLQSMQVTRQDES